MIGPLLWSRPAPADATEAKVPNYAVMQHDEDDPVSSDNDSTSGKDEVDREKNLTQLEVRPTKTYQELQAEGQERLHAKLRRETCPMGWAMRTLQ